MTEQIIDFTVDQAILHSIIKSQAGTLSKALLEGVMNAIDANAKKIIVTLTGEGFIVSDDGRGFRTHTEIEQWFGRFGTPHEEGDATYGKFRMGRGQMMAFAKTVWRTGPFEMKVDIATAMGFTLNPEPLPKVKGCTITGELYDKLSDFELGTVITDFKSLVKYAQVPVELNGVVISENPKKIKWDLQTDEAYIQVDREEGKRLKVYNLGVLVKEYSSYDFGCGGTVVTKQPVEVNFARNDILYKCKTWQKIKEFIRKANVDKVARNRKLNTGERAFLAKQFVYGHMKKTEVDPLDMKLITDITGRHHSIRDLTAAPRLTFATEKQGRAAEKFHRMGAAFVVSPETLTRFDASSVQELIDLLAGSSSLVFPEIVPFEKVAEGFSEDYTILAEDALTRQEWLAFLTVHEFHPKFYAWYSSNEKTSGVRRLDVGDSNVATAWTDGETYVALGIGLLRKVVRNGAAGFMDLLSTLTHEYVHETADVESHDHDLHFYNKYHDLMEYGGTGKLLKMSLDMEKAYYKALAKEGLAPAPAKAVSKAKSKAPASRPPVKPRPTQNQQTYHEVPQQTSFAMM
jgi:hypothetical protein